MLVLHNTPGFSQSQSIYRDTSLIDVLSSVLVFRRFRLGQSQSFRMLTLLLALILLPIVTPLNLCGPSSPSGFVIASWNGDGATKAAACEALNMDVAALTTINADEASSVIYSCLLERSHALISKWEGRTLDTDCLAAFVSTSSSGLSVASLPNCASHNSILCVKRRNQSIVLPSAPNETVTSTTTATLTSHYTSTISSLTATTTTSTSISIIPSSSVLTTSTNIAPLPLPVDACSVESQNVVFLQLPAISYVDVEAICASYGMQPGIINDLTDVNLAPCFADRSFVQAPVPAASYAALILTLYSTTGPGMSDVEVNLSGAPVDVWGTRRAICQRQILTPGGTAIEYVIRASLVTLATVEEAISLCQIANMQLAVYPVTAPLPPIQGFPLASARNAWSYAQMPIPALCNVIIPVIGPVGIYQDISFTSVLCDLYSSTARGVICQLPPEPSL